MEDLSTDVAELAADLKALLLDARARGVRELPVASGEVTEPPVLETEAARPPREIPRPTASRASGSGAEQGVRAARPVVAESVVEAPPEDPTAPAVGGVLAGLRKDLGDCQRCALAQGRKRLVFGSGDEAADLMIVGEAPGGQEDRTGLPFVGPAGRMLENMLRHVLGLEREQVYITNVVKCRPPGNRTPHPEEIGVCNEFLTRQIQAVQPKVILALGRPAAQTLLDTERGIKAIRGGWSAWQEIPVLPTFHPAYLLRQPQDKRLVFEDLKAVRQRYDELGGRR